MVLEVACAMALILVCPRCNLEIGSKKRLEIVVVIFIKYSCICGFTTRINAFDGDGAPE